MLVGCLVGSKKYIPYWEVLLVLRKWIITPPCKDPITEIQMMSGRGVFHHLRNARYLGSMIPFLEGEPGSLGPIQGGISYLYISYKTWKGFPSLDSNPMVLFPIRKDGSERRIDNILRSSFRVSKWCSYTTRWWFQMGRFPCSLIFVQMGWNNHLPCSTMTAHATKHKNQRNPCRFTCTMFNWDPMGIYVFGRHVFFQGNLLEFPDWWCFVCKKDSKIWRFQLDVCFAGRF